MFLELTRINERPAVFSQHTTDELWTDPHVSRQMLAYHLDGSVDISSYRTETVEAATAWMQETFHLGSGSRVLDLGCGPGLYTHRLAQAGIDVTGVDFSPGSIAYAREAATRDGLTIDYVNADYLSWQPGRRFDLVTLIMRDYGALSPDRRLTLLRTVQQALEPDGAFLFDVDSLAALERRSESASYSWSPQGGFWSANAYFEFVNGFVYLDDAVALTRHLILEADRTRAIYDWTQCFSPESLASELRHAGLEVVSQWGDVAGHPFDARSAQFAVVAGRR